MDVVVAHVVAELGRHRVGLADLLRLEARALQHVVEVRVAAEVELVGAQDLDAAVREEARQHAVGDRGAHLGLDVVADDGQAVLAEPLRPVARARDEDRHAVHEAASGLQDLLHVPLGGFLAAHGQVAHHHVRLRFLEHLDHVDGVAGVLLDDFAQVLAQAVVGHAPLYRHAQVRHVGELHRVVRMGENGLAQVLAHLVGAHVEGGRELDVADVIAAQVGVHQAGNELVPRGAPVILHALYQGRGTVAHADDGHSDFAAHVFPAFLNRQRARDTRTRIHEIVNCSDCH